MILSQRIRQPHSFSIGVASKVQTDIDLWLNSKTHLKSAHLTIPRLKSKQNFFTSLKSDIALNFHSKCAFCESAVDLSSLRIFRYRPFSLNQAVSPNYWWLSWQWPNLYLICTDCYSSYDKHEHGRSFPLNSTGRRIIIGEHTTENLFDITYLNKFEKPTLIDPCFDNPESLFNYHEDENGLVIPVTDGENLRVNTTISVFALDRDDLNLARKEALAILKSSFLEARAEPNETTFSSLLTLCKSNSIFAGMKRYFLRKWLDRDALDWPVVKIQLEKWQTEPPTSPEPWPAIGTETIKKNESTPPPKKTNLTVSWVNQTSKRPESEREIYELLVKELCGSFKKVIIKKEFGVGFSGAKVFLISRLKHNNKAAPPIIVKLDLEDKLRIEVQNYKDHNIASLEKCVRLETETLTVPNSVYGCIAYNFAGGGKFEVESLNEYWTHCKTVAWATAPLKTLFDDWNSEWGGFTQQNDLSMQSYDWLLPPNFEIAFLDSVDDFHGHVIMPNIVSSFLNTSDFENKQICLKDFCIREVDLVNQELILDLPDEYEQEGFRVRVYDVTDIEQFRVGETLPVKICGQVTNDRITLLKQIVKQTFQHTLNFDHPKVVFQASKVTWTLSNPLYDLAKILQTYLPSAEMSNIHGDMNLENILVRKGTQGSDIYVIDFGKTRTAQNIHDLLRLEVGVWLYLTASKMYHYHNENPHTSHNLIEIVSSMFVSLYKSETTSMLGEPKQKTFEIPYAILNQIRSKVFELMAGALADKHQKYYLGLCLYMLGALKYKNLDKPESHAPIPKQIAFLVACLAYECVQDNGLDMKAIVNDIAESYQQSDPRGSMINGDQLSKEEPPSLKSNEVVFLRDQISKAFNLNELKELCFELKIEYEDIPGDTRKTKAREIVQYYIRRNSIAPLIDHCKQERPYFEWDHLTY